MAAKANSTTIAVVSISFLVLIVLVFFVLKKIAKSQPPPNAVLPDDNNPGFVGSPFTAAEQATLTGLAGRIFDDINGISFSGHDNELYQECLNLSDRMATGLYNTYKQLYFSQHNETLTEALNNEIEPFGPRKIFAFANRLSALGLKWYKPPKTQPVKYVKENPVVAIVVVVSVTIFAYNWYCKMQAKKKAAAAAAVAPPSAG
jgi:hypothetical protein